MSLPAPRAFFVSTFPPRECGIASFARDLVAAYGAVSGTASLCAAVDELGAPARRYAAATIARIDQADRASYISAAGAANASACDVVCVQHEFGLFGGSRGDWVLDLLRALRTPAVTTLHTVLPDPDAEYARVTRAIAAASSLVVPSRTGRMLLIERYGIDPSRVTAIPHGVPDVVPGATDDAKQRLGLTGRATVLSFGLISSGKGLEDAIDAIPRVAAAHPNVLYLIVGQTHPIVRRHESERYRRSLEKRVARLGVSGHVRFVDAFVADDELLAYLAAADVVLAPYRNPAQIVSGTLAYATGAGRAVVATPFLHARELLADGCGRLVPFRDPGAIAAALVELLGDAGARESLGRRAFAASRSARWSDVARSYAAVFATLVAASRAADALVPSA